MATAMMFAVIAAVSMLTKFFRTITLVMCDGESAAKKYTAIIRFPIVPQYTAVGRTKLKNLLGRRLSQKPTTKMQVVSEKNQAGLFHNTKVYIAPMTAQVRPHRIPNSLRASKEKIGPKIK